MGEVRGLEILDSAAAWPTGGGDVVVLVSLCVLRGIELVEGFHDEPIGPQAAHAVAVVGWNSIQPAGQSHLAGVGVLARHFKTT